ncbi:MAG TPA: hypothetical protein PLK05_11665 [Steroidobacteraceae bacterium]|nr:hypothetical protein [Steroidobacteraceae bacterium]
MPTAINIQLVTDRVGGELTRLLPPSSGVNARQAAEVLASELHRIASGVGAGRIRMQADTLEGVAASVTVTCTTASATAGDNLTVGVHTFTCAASPVAASGQYDSAAGTDDLYATSLAAAINGVNSADFYATAATNVVTITARRKGTAGNAFKVVKTVTTAGTFALSAATFTGGVDPGAQPSLTVTFGGVGVANEILTIGNQTITMKASAGNESECTIGGDASISATNMIAKINAHTALRGLMTASSGGSGVVTLTMLMGARVAALCKVTTNITSCTVSNSGKPTTTATATRLTDGLSFALGML